MIQPTQIHEEPKRLRAPILKKVLKSVLFGSMKAVSPAMAERLNTYLIRRHILRFEASLGLPQLVERFLTENECIVHGGPFASMAYIPNACGSALLPKLIGTYEMELAPVIDEVVRRSPPVVVDIGCAEGYYAIGLARKLPTAKVLAYDTDRDARNSCQQLAGFNQVMAQIEVHGRCDHAELNRVLRGFALVVCDCEGFEWTLLDPQKAAALQGCDLLVELHSHEGIDPQWVFSKRFAETHEITYIHARARTDADIADSVVAAWPSDSRLLACNEFRTNGQLWAFAKTRQLLTAN